MRAGFHIDGHGNQSETVFILSLGAGSLERYHEEHE